MIEPPLLAAAMALAIWFPPGITAQPWSEAQPMSLKGLKQLPHKNKKTTRTRRFFYF